MVSSSSRCLEGITPRRQDWPSLLPIVGPIVSPGAKDGRLDLEEEGRAKVAIYIKVVEADRYNIGAFAQPKSVRGVVSPFKMRPSYMQVISYCPVSPS